MIINNGLSINARAVSFTKVNDNAPLHKNNRIASFEKCKQLSKYQHLLLLRDIWKSKF
jgi:hypothetical protein